jgi:hypothetical protein
VKGEGEVGWAGAEERLASLGLGQRKRGEGKGVGRFWPKAVSKCGRRERRGWAGSRIGAKRRKEEKIKRNAFVFFIALKLSRIQMFNSNQLALHSTRNFFLHQHECSKHVSKPYN